MKTKGVVILILFMALLCVPAYSMQAEENSVEAPKPLEKVSDIVAWKGIRSSSISKNGTWLAYYLLPGEGDGEVIFREIQGDRELRFSAGEAPQFGQRIDFSEDTSWAAFTEYPSREEAKKLKKQKKKLYNKMVLVNLSSGEKTEFDKTQSFSFSGENSAFIAYLKYPAENQSSGKDGPSGRDLILRELSSEKELNIGNVSEFAFDKRGFWMAWTVDAADQTGNGIMLRNMKTGVILPVDNDKAKYTKLTWKKEGGALAVLKGKEDKKFEDRLYSVVGITRFDEGSPHKVIFDPVEDSSFPDGMTVSPNRDPLWTEDLSGILFGIQKVEAKPDEEADKEKKSESEEKDADKEKSAPPKPTPKKDIDKEDLPDLVIWHWKDDRLQAQQQVQESRDRNFSYLAVFRIKENKFIRLADEELKNVTPAPKHIWGVGIDRQRYELAGNLDGRRYQDIYVVNLTTGARRLAVEKCRWFFGPSPDGTHFLYFDDGHFYTYEMSSNRFYNITRDVPTTFVNTEDDHNVVNPPIQPRSFGWVKGDGSLLLYNNWDIWHIPVHGGKGVNLTINGKQDSIRYNRRFSFDPDEEGIDLKAPLYLTLYGEWTKKSGIGVIEKGRPGVKRLLWDDASFSLSKAKDADVYLYSRQTYKDYPDLYAAGPQLQNGRRLTVANPQQKNFLWSSGSLLVDYESTHGDKLQAALFLPANYEEGKRYPTIVYMYEKMSQTLNSYTAPRAAGFNKSVYTSRGYAVLMPDIRFQVNDPGTSSVGCILPAVEAAVEMGVVDRDKVGIHGHSWGGYQSSFIVTQTDLFKACVTGAPLTNMISMYSSIYWNSGSANQPIFESSQGRFTGGYWENLDAYARNSPVYFAQNVKTPMIILHNDKDGAVDWNQGIEYYNTLRRLEKPVVMLQYKGENHGLRKPANMQDYYVRMMEFFDHYLMGKSAPEWWTEGVAHLDHEKHIKKRAEKIVKQKEEAVKVKKK